MNRNRLVLSLAVIAATVGLLVAGDPETVQVPRASPTETGKPLSTGGARLELDVPQHATVEVDGSTVKPGNDLQLSGMDPRKRYEYNVHVQLSDTQDVRRLVYVEAGQTVRVAVAAPDPVRREMVLQDGHKRFVSAVALSPDGAQLLSVSLDRTAILWDATTGEIRRVLRGHRAAVFAAAFSPDGKRVATADEEGVALVWEAESGKRVAGWDDGAVVVWDATSGKSIRTEERLKKPVQAVSVGPNDTVAAGYADGVVSLWDGESGKAARASNMPRLIDHFALPGKSFGRWRRTR